jgi:hypothetical protein
MSSIDFGEALSPIEQVDMLAAIATLGHSGATGLKVEETGHGRWRATCQWNRVLRKVDEQPGPLVAVMRLMVKVVTGATCRHCGRPVSLTPAAGKCLWVRQIERQDVTLPGHDIEGEPMAVSPTERWAPGPGCVKALLNPDALRAKEDEFYERTGIPREVDPTELDEPEDEASGD